MPQRWSENALLHLVMQAKPLTERLTKTTPEKEVAQESILGRQRRDEWCQLVADGNDDVFRRRLAWDGLDVDAARRALTAPSAEEGKPLPAWAVLLDEAVRYRSVPQTTTKRFIDDGLPLPFEEVLAPFVIVARHRLRKSAGSAHALLLNQSHAALERNLLEALAAQSAQTFHAEFSLFRAQHQSAPAGLFARTLLDPDRTLYQAFVLKMRQGGLGQLLLEYAVLGRLLGVITSLWIEANCRFMQQLENDRHEIRRIFGISVARGSVRALQPALSDPHNGRTSVIAMTFSAGRQLIYKPRDVGVETAYQNLLNWLNDQGLAPRLRVLNVLNRGTHGWVEYAKHIAITSTDDARRYYQRAGMLLCLVYSLEGTDFHSENIIAHGEHPVLVDMEMLFCHRVKDDTGLAHLEGTGALALAQERLTHSVLSTGLLPRLTGGHEGEGVDASGLGGVDVQVTPCRTHHWDGINTDRMVLERGSVTLRPDQNVVLLDGRVARANDYAEALSDGFTRMYRFLLDRNSALLAATSPLYQFAGQTVRYLHRQTQTYAALHSALLNPRYQRNGVDRGIRIDLLSRELLGKGERPESWPLLEAERRAIEQVDIPFFQARADSADLVLSTGDVIIGFFKEPSFDLVLSRVAALSEQDLACQLGFIEGSLPGRAADSSAPFMAVKSPKACTPAELSASDLKAVATSIADEIRDRAICASDGSATWIGSRYVEGADRIEFQPLGFDLYDGACGVALFLSAVAATTEVADLRALAWGAVQPLWRMLSNECDAIADRLGIGGGAGLGGVVYSFVCMSQLLNEPALLSAAHAAAGLITADRIVADTSLDVLDGAAGAILGLVALYELSCDPNVLDRAVICAEHVLSMRKVSTSQYRSWSGKDGYFLTGFSHGAAGIAYALLRLYQQTNDDRLLAAAREGVAYEDTLLDLAVGNWPDLLAQNGERFQMQWCHGAPGVGLARLGMHSILGSVEFQEDVEIALASTEHLSVGDTDHLCCGNLGRIEFLLSAGTRLGRPRLTESAWRQAALVVSRAKEAQHFALDPLLPRSVFSPGFFVGTAGIGYELLRLAYPGRLPSVLLWEVQCFVDQNVGRP